MARAKSDGNGGYDINVQRRELWKLVGGSGILIIALGAGAQALGEQAWEILANDRAQQQKIGQLDQSMRDHQIEFMQHEKDQAELVRDFLLEMQGVREELVRVRTTLEGMD